MIGFIASSLKVGAAEQVDGKDAVRYHHRCDRTGRGRLAFRFTARDIYGCQGTYW